MTDIRAYAFPDEDGREHLIPLSPERLERTTRIWRGVAEQMRKRYGDDS